VTAKMTDDRLDDGRRESARPAGRPLDPALVAAIIDSAPDGILIVDASGRIAFTNHRLEEMLGYERDALSGRSVEVLVPDEARSAHATYRGRYAAHPRARPMGVGLQLEARRSDGSDVPVEISLSPVQTADAGFTVAVVRDVSERLRAEEELRAAQEELALLADRERIARDLHDTVLQRLFATGLALQSTAGRVTPEIRDRIESAVAELDTAIRDIRTAIFSLHAPSDPGSFRDRVMVVAAEATRALGFAPVVRFEGPVDAAVSGEAGEALVAVLREALSNVARHAAATAVDVEVSAGDGLALRVTDNGAGLPEAARLTGGRGLANMAERARTLGGDCQVATGADGGTIVSWAVPTPA